MPVVKLPDDDRLDDEHDDVASRNYVFALCVRQYHDGRQRSDWPRQISGAQGRHHQGQSALQLSTKLFPVGGGICFLLMS